jgi:hypothetical protein
MATWRDVIEEAAGSRGPESVAIGGKSMGGRIATMVADEAKVAGLVCFGYPFHPPGNPEKLRVAHLEELKTPTLILQGERDQFGMPPQAPGREVVRVRGDHGLKADLAAIASRMKDLSAQLREIEVQTELSMRSRMTELHESGGECDSGELDSLTRVQDLTVSLAAALTDMTTVQLSLRRHVDDAEAALSESGLPPGT